MYNSARLSIRQLHQVAKNVVTTDSERMVVAWHPKPAFPYEATLPLPKTETAETSTVLNVSPVNEMLSMFKSKTPDQARAELMAITHTTKHRWFPRARDKRAKKTPMNRDYL